MDAGSGHTGLDAGGIDRAGTPAQPALPVVRCILWHTRGSTLPGPLITALDRPTVQWKAWDCDLLTLAELVRPNAAPDQLTHDARAKVIVLVDPSRLVGLANVLDTLERYRPGTPLWVYEGIFEIGASPKLAGMSLSEVRARFVERGKIDAAGADPTTAQARTPASVITAPTLTVVTRPVGTIVPKPIVPKPLGQPHAPARPQPSSPPSLRLAGEDVSPATMPAPARRPAPPVSPAIDGGSRNHPETRDPESHDPDSHDSRPGVPLLSEEEIEMLLSDPPPKDHKGGHKGGSKGAGGSGGTNGRGGNVR